MPSFYALQPRWLGADRLYKVFCSPQRLAFGYVAGQVYDLQAAAVQLQQLNLVLFPLVRKWLRQREERERAYDSEDVFGRGFLPRDPRNFYLDRRDVSGIAINWRRSLWTTANAGTLTVRRRDTSERRFVLTGEQFPDDVLAALGLFWPTVETAGTPRLPKGPRGFPVALRHDGPPGGAP